MSDLFAGFETIGAALSAVRRDFGAALEAGDALMVADTRLRVDQVRGIASMVSADDVWAERDGKRLIRNDTVLGRAFLAYVVGTGRYLSAADFVRVLAGLRRGDLDSIRESDVAQFVNLTAAEPHRDPRSELVIWATVAHKIATGRETDYFSQEIPGLVTSYDLLYEEIPAGAQLAEGLLPSSATPRAPTLERYEAGLRDEVGPDLAEYVRSHLLPLAEEAPS